MGFLKKCFFCVSVGIYDILSSRKKLNECIINSEIPNLDIVTANENLLGVEIELSSDEDRAVKLRESLNNTFSDQKDYDFILLDCPPALNIITLNALAASDGAIVPLQAEFYALEGLSQLLKTIDSISSTINEKLKTEPTRIINLLTHREGKSSVSFAPKNPPIIEKKTI